ncbi:MAG: DNA translocase FtsK 4TM domain-containing protein [Spirosomataceae bacterium]
MAKNVIPPTNSPKRERKTTSASGDSKQTSIPFKKRTSDPRNTQFLGWIFVFLSIYMLCAFVWYLFTGASDQSVVDSAFTTKMRVSEQETKNIMGFFGLVIAHYFIFRWFGIAAFGLPFLLFLFGFKIARKRELLPLNRTTQLTLAYMIWLSIFFGFFVLQTSMANNLSILCGGIGYEINLLLDHYIGWGALLIIFGLLSVILVYFHGISSLDEVADLVEKPFKKRAVPVDFEVILEEEKPLEQEVEEAPESSIASAYEKADSQSGIEKGQPIDLTGSNSNGKAPARPIGNLTLIVENADEIVKNPQKKN